MFQDAVKGIWVLDIMVVCDSVQKSWDMSDRHEMAKINRYPHLDGDPRF